MGSININYEEKTESYEMETLPEQQGCDTSELKREVDELNENLTAFDVDTQTYSTETFKFAKSGEDLGMLDSEGNFMAFGGSGKIYYLGQGTSFDIKSLLPQKYADLTAENFLVAMKSISIAADSGNSNSASTTSDFVKTYKDGVLTIKNTYTAYRKTGEAYYEYMNATATLTCEVYLVIGDVPFLKFIV